MKIMNIILPLLCVCSTMAAQEGGYTPRHNHVHEEDSTDVFFRHSSLSEVTVTGVTGETKLRNATAPVSIVSSQLLRSTASTNIIDAIASQPGISQLTTGGSISKPIIRGLGYNRVVVMSDGVRQEGQQWGDEHGVEIDGSTVGSVEILKGPASLMYGSDAMAGVVLMHPRPLPADGDIQVNASSEYQTNNGLFRYSLQSAGNRNGFVWDAAFSNGMAHSYKDRYDGYVPGSQFRDIAGRLRIGLNKQWGHSWLTWTYFHLTPSIIEGERNEETGELEHGDDFRSHSYGSSLPFQQVKHQKLVWDNTINLGAGYLKAIVGYQQNNRQEYEEERNDYELYFKLHTLTYDLRFLTHDMNGWKLSTGIGGMVQRSDNKGEEYLIPDYRLYDIGLFATMSKTIASHVTMNGGLRYDHRRLHGRPLTEDNSLRFNDITRHFNGVTGSIGAVWNINKQWNMRMNVARGFRTPNMSELASNGVHEGSLRYEVGNEALKAEYSLQTDLGIDLTTGCLTAQLALFANKIDNYIFTHRISEVMEEGYMTYAYTQGDARLMGFEAGIDLHPIHSLHLENTFSYVNARQLHAEKGMKHLPFTPAPRWTSELKWELLHHAHSTINHHHHTAKDSQQGMYHSKRLGLNNLYVAAAMECFLRQDKVRNADNTESATPSYTLVNLSAGTDVIIGKRKVAEVFLTADNIFNRAYQNHLNRLKYADMNTQTNRRGVYDMGRNITIKLVIPIDISTHSL